MALLSQTSNLRIPSLTYLLHTDCIIVRGSLSVSETPSDSMDPIRSKDLPIVKQVELQFT